MELGNVLSLNILRQWLRKLFSEVGKGCLTVIYAQITLFGYISFADDDSLFSERMQQ